MRIRARAPFGIVTLMSVVSLAAAGGQTGKSSTTAKTDGKEVFLSVRGDVNKADADGTTALHSAVEAGDKAKVQALLRAGATVNVANRYRITPLSLAATNGDSAMIDLLLKAGADPNATLNEGQTILMTAARTGKADAVKTLVDHGAKIDAKETWYGQTAIMWAAAENHPDVVKLLAEHGADVNGRANVVAPPRTGDAMNLTTLVKGGFTPLLYVARNGALESARALAEAGADLNLPDPDGITPLVVALLSGHYDVAKLLIEKGADVNKADRTGRTPLYVAVDMHTLEWRFNRPAPKQHDKFGTDPVDLVKLLLEHGADVNGALTANIIPPKTNANGNPNLSKGSTPFLKAASTSDLELMHLLLDWGADPWVTNQLHTNALMMAAGLNWRVLGLAGLNRQEDAIEAIKLLLDLGFDVNTANDQGNTALHGAAQRTPDRDANKLIQFLVDRGANVNALNKNKRRPLDEALGEDPATAGANNERRGPNHRTAALLRQLMGLPPDPADQIAAAQGQ